MLIFFKTVDDLRPFVPQMQLTFQNLDSLNADIIFAQEKYIKDALGKSLYDSLLAVYNNATPDANQQALIDKVQPCLANFAFDKIIIGQMLQIGEGMSGFFKSQNHSTAWDWQTVRTQKDYFLLKGFEQLEWLLGFLDENQANYLSWVSSNAYTAYKQFIIQTAKEFSVYYGIQDNYRTFRAFRPIIKDVEDSVIQGTVGTPLYNEIKQQVKDETLSADNKELMPFIKPAIANLTVWNALRILPLDINAQGIVVKETAAVSGGTVMSKTADLSYSQNLASNVNERGYRYLQGLNDYLNANASAVKYQLYFESSLYTAPADVKTIVDVNPSRGIFPAI